MQNIPFKRALLPLACSLALYGCVGDESSSSSGGTTNTEDVSTLCSSSDLYAVVCAANDFLDTLSSDEQVSLLLEWTDSSAKTVWSNLPGVTRNGLALGDLSEESLAAALALAKVALSEEGYTDLTGVLAADDYLNAYGSSGNAVAGSDESSDSSDSEESAESETPPAPPEGDMTPPDGGMAPPDGAGGGATNSAYGAANYHIALLGVPSVDGDWMLQFGGHHMAYNITYRSGVVYPVPNHLGVEPKVAFEQDGETYSPMLDEGAALVAMFAGLDENQLAAAYLSDEAYADVLVGPDNGSGVLPTDYPIGSNRRGVLVSELTQAQQALVRAAVLQWVGDYPASVADPLMADYFSAAALADTYIAWAGTESAGVDVDVSGTYMRIDGPRLWIEVACQSGVIIQGQTHYHSVYRDKTMDYGDSL
ncbi:MAG: DUF3500 domain-containing protein [Oceanospirillaceae bacterium]|nr:DUF3500 domain-containing protein [Oceanospirillaceae bacterium]MCP5335601.1 DUF3500 domain-containing protein [Oceanospirillaceae bacterium]